MNNYRVIISGNSGDGFIYRIEEVIDRPNTFPFVRHEPSIVSAGSLEELKNNLQKMLDACDKKPLCLMPESLKEVDW